MKIFNYECQNCQNFIEKFVKTSDEVVQCPKCEHAMEKRLTMPAFTLKGEGFYGRGTYAKAADGPKLDEELLRMSDRDLNVALNLPPDLA